MRAGVCGWVCVVWLAGVSGCAPSEEEVQADFADFIDAHNHCDLADECTRISPGCPLGCATAVRRDAAPAAEALARDLIEDYESLGTACAYGCVGSQGIACVNSRCELCDPPATEADASCQVLTR